MKGVEFNKRLFVAAGECRLEIGTSVSSVRVAIHEAAPRAPHGPDIQKNPCIPFLDQSGRVDWWPRLDFGKSGDLEKLWKAACSYAHGGSLANHIYSRIPEVE